MKNVSFLVAFCLVFVLKLRQQSKCMYYFFFVCLFFFFKEKLTLKKCSYFLRFFHRDSLLSVKERIPLDIINMKHRALFDF